MFPFEWKMLNLVISHKNIHWLLFTFATIAIEIATTAAAALFRFACFRGFSFHFTALLIRF